MTRRIIAVALLLGLTASAGAVTKKPVMGGVCANWGAALAPLLQCVKIGPTRYVWAQLKLTETGPPPLTDTAPKAPPVPVPIAVTATASVVPVSLTAPVTAAPATSASASTAPAITAAAPANTAAAQVFSGSGGDRYTVDRSSGGTRARKVLTLRIEQLYCPLHDSGGARGVSIANEIGATQGTIVDDVSPPGRYAVNVQADGAWTIEVSQPRPTSGQPVPAKFTGRGPSVIGPLKGTTALRVSMVHDGTSNFIVTPFKLTGRDGGLANEIGPFTGTQSYRATGVFYIRIIADGNWSIDMQPL